MHYKTGRNLRCIILTGLIIFLLLSACTSKNAISKSYSEEDAIQMMTKQTEGKENVPEDIVEEKENSAQIQTKYLPLFYPSVYSEVLRHREVISEDIAMEVFSMESDGIVRELFRIYFGDEAMGIISGYLTVDGEEIPVTYSVCQYNDEDFHDEEARSQYLETMTCFNEIMNCIQSDDRFSTEKAKASVNYVDTDLSYWSFALPSTMEYKEQKNNGQYLIRFYGNVVNEKIALYTIILGKPTGETVLGSYEVDGNKQLLSVESYSIVPQDDWTEEDITSAYTMMATINDVIQVIMSSENFSEEVSNG